MSEIILIMVAAVIFLTGFAIGTDMGAERACKSVKLEWVNDKCMKVIMEELK